MRKNKITSFDKSKESKSSKNKKAKKYKKFDIIQDENDEEENKQDDDDFIVKMILKPVCSNEMNDEALKISETAKLLKKAKKYEKKIEQKTTLTQMVRSNSNKFKNEENSNNQSSDDELSESSSESDSESENELDKAIITTDESKASKNYNTNLYLSAYEGGPKQRLLLLNLLYEVKPTYIILYDSQMWFIRSLEIYKTTYYYKKMRYYILMYTNSCEEQKYLTSIRSEKESFEILIREKAVRFTLILLVFINLIFFNILLRP